MRNNISPSSTASGRHGTTIGTTLFPISSQPTVDPLASLSNTEDMEIKPGIAEMIREEERVSLILFILHSFLFLVKRMSYFSAKIQLRNAVEQHI